jgi:hypothetical protein
MPTSFPEESSGAKSSTLLDNVLNNRKPMTQPVQIKLVKPKEKANLALGGGLEFDWP